MWFLRRFLLNFKESDSIITLAAMLVFQMKRKSQKNVEDHQVAFLP
jgi:hypothetical protein